MNWLQNHLKTIVTAASVTGTVLAVVAANTTGLLPQTVGAWLASAGAIILGTIAALTGEPVVRGIHRKLKGQ